jgi:hypothetical protein
MILTHDTDAAIERATFRAKARRIQAQFIEREADGFDRTEYYAVGSFSRSALSHRVTLVYTAEGVTASCDCEAGQNGLICQHIAAALMAEEAPQVEPEPSIVETLGATFISRLMDPDRAEAGHQSEIERKRQQAGSGPIPTAWDRMSEFERIIMVHIGAGFWIEDGTIGVIDNRDADTVHERLRAAAQTLGCAGYTLHFGRRDGQINRLHVKGGTPQRVSF